MDIVVGVVCIAIGAYLFRDPARRPKDRRIYKLFTLIGAIIGYFFAWMFEPFLGGVVPMEYMGIGAFVVGGMIAYNLARMAEDAIVVLGPSMTIILGYDYLRVEKGIDLLDFVDKIPQIPNISNEILEGLLFLTCAFFSLAFRYYLRRLVPTIISGLLSGTLLVTGFDTVLTGSLPSSGYDLELRFSALVAAASIGYQLYFHRKLDEEKMESRIYSSDSKMRDLRDKAQEAKKGPKGFGATIMVPCPLCSVETNHQVINRKQRGDGADVMVKCLRKNQFDEVCNKVHTVRELRSG